jgi:5-oxopent-3-ene-1,2,5-tricarboxylate decarboxylase / 2-hydroxyhepta-2,4-diene-1,7-dioate isomerase
VRTARFVADGRELVGTPADDGGALVDEDGRRHLEGDVTFLPPIVPRTVLALALNYAEHAEEFEMEAPEAPALFLKPPNTWIGHRRPVVYPREAEYVHYECELAVVIVAFAGQLTLPPAFDRDVGEPQRLQVVAHRLGPPQGEVLVVLGLPFGVRVPGDGHTLAEFTVPLLDRTLQ